YTTTNCDTRRKQWIESRHFLGLRVKGFIEPPNSRQLDSVSTTNCTGWTWISPSGPILERRPRPSVRRYWYSAAVKSTSPSGPPSSVCGKRTPSSSAKLDSCRQGHRQFAPVNRGDIEKHCRATQYGPRYNVDYRHAKYAGEQQVSWTRRP